MRFGRTYRNFWACTIKDPNDLYLLIVFSGVAMWMNRPKNEELLRLDELKRQHLKT